MAGTCIVNGCDKYADKVFGVRLRREHDRGTAIWAPNTTAYICDDHAACGFDVEVNLTIRNDKTVKTSVSESGGNAVVRLHDITKPVNPDD
ncbi:TPA: hypothetical protein ACJFUB_004227 [Yersinia enterocolitica]|uniref:hypothetical protein n=1 Tax=Yersinia intermedia TaxID=631 RepID=UPI001CFC55DB|nr:hypothetical protein [Yersinia intermedia]HDL6761862.1 hypothetical protein [Yersinia enterocolitica]MCB5313627.1 hypothetical protein [Yersinia intermedia]HDM8441818.1 hypothetical protein [Yersinia enterocolitica]HDV0806185.1 hypothetical protein [Yersinia enterocolitica]HDZ9670518.1 hypothetical protein [Yersinia enterocolitica]